MTLQLWLMFAGVVVATAVCMIALGDAGRPVVRRRGPVLRALERRQASIDERKDAG